MKPFRVTYEMSNICVTTEHPMGTPVVVDGLTGQKKKFNGIEGRTESHFGKVPTPKDKVTVRLNHDNFCAGVTDLPRKNVFLIHPIKNKKSTTHQNNTSKGEVANALNNKKNNVPEVASISKGVKDKVDDW